MEKKNKIFLMTIDQLIFVISLLLISTTAQITLISTCTALQNMTTNNSTLIYQLTTNIDCNNIPFISIGNYSTQGQFQGKLDGMGFSILNINISSTLNYTGIFGFGSSSTVTNLTIQNIQIISTTNIVGTLFGRCNNCYMSNINLTTSNSSITNIIQGSCSAGGLVGIACSTNITNCVIENTYVYGTIYDIGGIIGFSVGGQISNCYNLGILSNPNQVIVKGSFNIGGIIGYCDGSSVNNSGIAQGIISASTVAGGVAGQFFNSNFLSKLFVLSGVSISGFCDIGGIVGRYGFNILANYSIDNSYSKANITGNFITGGLSGSVRFGGIGIGLNFSNCYSSSILTILLQI
jgi:hypothetical protein